MNHDIQFSGDGKYAKVGSTIYKDGEPMNTTTMNWIGEGAQVPKQVWDKLNERKMDPLIRNRHYGKTHKPMNWIDEKMSEFEKEYPPFRGIGARHPIFNETPVYTHITRFIRTALEEARLNGYNAGLADGTGKPLIAIEMIREEARTQGAQEALAKVEEWAKYHKPRDVRTDIHDNPTPAEAHVRGRVLGAKATLDDLLHHLQQLKDNTKTV